MSAQLARPNPRFNLGQVVATPGAIEALAEVNCLPITLLNRHQIGDWGNLCDDDKAANNEALGIGRDCSQLISSRTLSSG